MKAIPLTILLLLPLSSVAVAEVKVGEPLADVRATLGIPRGQMLVGEREFFYYDRGEVEARSGVVTRVSLRSAEEQAVLESRRSADVLRVREEQEIRRARLSSEGEALKVHKLTDPAFQASPLSYQVAFWEDFSRRYSDVPCAELLNETRVRLAVQKTEAQTQNEQARRLAELEARVAAAESEVRSVTTSASADVAFVRSYYPSYRGQRDYYRAPNPVKIETRMYEFPLPYATSPGMPLMQPTYRKDPAPFSRRDHEENFNQDDTSRRSNEDQSLYRGRSDSRRY
jgi:hypothetical protein